MIISIFFIFILFLFILLLSTVFIYLQIYKRKINKTLNTTEKTSKMPSPYQFAIVLTIIILSIGMVASYFIGYKVAYDRFENSARQLSASDIQTFYANIQSIDENTLTVNGISLNEEAYRGTFEYNVTQATVILYKEKTITFSDLKSGDFVAITLITAGGDVVDIYKIQLLSE